LGLEAELGVSIWAAAGVEVGKTFVGFGNLLLIHAGLLRLLLLLPIFVWKKVNKKKIAEPYKFASSKHFNGLKPLNS
jgi:hypothetical protein